MAEDIASFIEENQKFLKLEDAQTFEGYYVSSKIIPNRFKADTETIEYVLRTLRGRQITWTNGTLNVATRMHEAKPGDRIKITRNGLGNKTNYIVLTGSKLGPAIDISEEAPF